MWAAVASLFVVRLVWAIFEALAEGESRIAPRVIDEVTGTATAVPLVLLVAWWAVRQRHGFVLPLRGWLLAAAAFVVLSAAHTTLIVLARAALYPMAGLPPYRVDLSLPRYLYEGATNLVNTVAIAAVFTAARAIEARRRREREADAAQRALLEAELRTLRQRLEPHFLFNALNTIAATMHEDVAAADAQVVHLGALLRAALQHADVPLVPLETELALFEHYLALVRARFEDRLTVHVHVAPDVRTLLVPSLLLQPLVENAVRHGGVETRGTGVIAVEAQRVGDRLLLVVRDDGAGPPEGVDIMAAGTGLSATAHRLRLHYGPAHALRTSHDADGFAVRIELPITPSVAAESTTRPAPRV